jgi:hypothetical protein
VAVWCPSAKAVRKLTEDEWRRAIDGDVKFDLPMRGLLPPVTGGAGGEKEAISLLGLERWSLALDSADLALAATPTCPRALEARAVALLMLQRPQEAQEVCKLLPRGEPTGRHQRLHADIARAIQEKHGTYDTGAMMKEAINGVPPQLLLEGACVEGACVPRGRLSRRHADFFGPFLLEKVSLAHGKHYVTREHLGPGSLVMAVKSLAWVSAGSVNTSGSSIISLPPVSADGRVESVLSALVLPAVVRAVLDRPECAEALYSLSGGPGWPAGPPAYPGAVDMRRIEAIVSNNKMDVQHFGGGHLCHAKELFWRNNSGCVVPPADQGAAHAEMMKQLTQPEACGLWVAPSLLPHSCIPNCQFEFIGDFCFVTTNRDVPAGAVLTLPFIQPLVLSFEQRTSQLANWNGGTGLECYCDLCLDCRACPTLSRLEERVFSAYKAVNEECERGLPHKDAPEFVLPSASRKGLRDELGCLPPNASAAALWLLLQLDGVHAAATGDFKGATSFCEHRRDIAARMVGVTHSQYVEAEIHVAWCALASGQREKAKSAIKVAFNAACVLPKCRRMAILDFLDLVQAYRVRALGATPCACPPWNVVTSLTSPCHYVLW